MAEASVDIQDVARSMTMRVRVKGVRVFRARLWLGTLLLRLAARLIGCGIEIEGCD